MDISVIVPVYGAEKYIEKCLRSLFVQTKSSDVELVLVNDCTPDRSMLIARDIINDYPKANVKIVDLTLNSGSSVARRTGVENSVGKYTIQIDSDDWVEPTMLEELYNKAVECDADIVGCDYIIDRPYGSQYVSMPMGNNNIECLKMMLSTKLTQSLCFKMVKRELYNQQGVKFYLDGVDSWEDFVASAKLYYYAKKVAYVPKAFYHYVQISSDSITRCGFSQKRLDNIVSAVKETESFFKTTEELLALERSIIDRKIYAKHTLIRHGGVYQKKYISAFPEVNKYILKQKGMPLHNRIALYFAVHKCVWLYNFIIWSVQQIKKTLK